MRTIFVNKVLSKLTNSGQLSPCDRILTVCAGIPEAELFQSLGFPNVTITNLDSTEQTNNYGSYPWIQQNAMQLTFPDKEFDFAFVSDGLHHCSSPHRAVTEMYRVSKKGIIVIESRDSLLVRLAVAMNISSDYEIGAVDCHYGEFGGVDNTSIPNHVYRWTEREFKKTIRSFDPCGHLRFSFIHGFNPPSTYQQSGLRAALKRAMITIASVMVSYLMPKQANGFAMIALKPRIPEDLWPWLRHEEGAVRYRFKQDAKLT